MLPMSMVKNMKIQEVSEATGLSKDMIRFYESEGLIKPARNEDNNYRSYSENDCYLLVMIKLYNSLGISLKDIKAFMQNRDMDLARISVSNSVIELEKEKLILEQKIKNAKEIQSLLQLKVPFKIIEKEDMFFYPLTSDNEKRFPILFEKYGAGIPVCKIQTDQYSYEQGFLFHKILDNRLEYKKLSKGLYCDFKCEVRHGELIPKELLQPKLDEIEKQGYHLTNEAYAYLIMGSSDSSYKYETIFITIQVM